jgi:Cytochrome P460
MPVDNAVRVREDAGMRQPWTLTALAVTLALVACGSRPMPRDERKPTSPGTPWTGAGQPGGPGAAGSDRPVDLPAEATTVPVKPAELQAWLIAAHYRKWAHESKPHESTGPHEETVKTFISPSLRASLQQRDATHPEGAAAVKELYDGSGQHKGWAVSVKVAADSASGKGWYWYEVFSTAPDAKPAYEGVGKELCRDCHTEKSVDQVLVPFPLQ